MEVNLKQALVLLKFVDPRDDCHMLGVSETILLQIVHMSVEGKPLAMHNLDQLSYEIGPTCRASGSRAGTRQQSE